jgi:hypothetical protein
MQSDDDSYVVRAETGREEGTHTVRFAAGTSGAACALYYRARDTRAVDGV